MITFGETRLFHTLHPAIPGLRRIAMIGDSMTYGAAVTPSETLPSNLERSLNALVLDQFFQVVNLGRNGSNLWQAWSTFEREGADLGFDAVVLNICNNDTRIFDGAVAYWNDGMPWQGTFEFEVAKRTLAHVKQFADERGLPAIVHFYSFFPPDDDRIAAIAEVCAAIDLPFVDMRSHFEEAMGTDVSILAASVLDSHPSPRAHQVASRRLAEAVAAIIPPPSMERPPDLAAEALSLVGMMRRQGRDADECLDWGLRVVETKGAAWRRRLSKPEGTTIGDAADAARSLREQSAAWRRLQEVGATLRLMATKERDLLWAYLVTFDYHLKYVDEALFDAQRGVAAQHQAELADLLSDAPLYKPNLERMRTLGPDQIGAVGARASDVLHLLAPANAVEFLGMCERLPALDTFLELVRRFASQVEQALALPALQDQPGPDGAFRANILRQAAFFHIDRADVYLKTVSDLIRPARETATAAAFTCIDVMIEAPEGTDEHDPRTFLYVTADYLFPSRRRFSERQICGLEKRRWVYHFELPFFALADVRVSIPADGPGFDRFAAGRVSITSVQVYHAEGADVTAQKTGVRWAAPQGGATSTVFLPNVRPDECGQVFEAPRRGLRPALEANLLAAERSFSSAQWLKARSEIQAVDEPPAVPGLVPVRLTEDLSADSMHDIRRSVAIAPQEAEYTFSFFARAGERTGVWAWLGENGPLGRAEALFDLSSGLVPEARADGSSVRHARAGMVPLADGWWWCWIIAQVGGLERLHVLVGLAGPEAALVYNGDGCSGVWLSGPRLEHGSRPLLDLG